MPESQRTWAQAHRVFAAYGLEYIKNEKGCVISLDSIRHYPTSKVADEISLSSLEHLIGSTFRKPRKREQAELEQIRSERRKLIASQPHPLPPTLMSAKHRAAYMQANDSDIAITGRALFHENHCIGEYRLPNNATERFLADFPIKSLVINRLGHPSVFFFKKKHLTIQYDENLLYFSDTDYYSRLITAANMVTIYPEALVAISWKKSNQLSNTFRSDPKKTLAELFFVHSKYNCNSYVRGISTARLCASNIRHWHSSIVDILSFIKNRMSYSAFFTTCASMPFFLAFMAYRLAYRVTQNKGWG